MDINIQNKKQKQQQQQQQQQKLKHSLRSATITCQEGL